MAVAVAVAVVAVVASKLLRTSFLSESTDRRFVFEKFGSFYYLHDHGNSYVTPGLFPTWEGNRKSNALFFFSLFDSLGLYRPRSYLPGSQWLRAKNAATRGMLGLRDLE